MTELDWYTFSYEPLFDRQLNLLVWAEAYWKAFHNHEHWAYTHNIVSQRNSLAHHKRALYKASQAAVKYRLWNWKKCRQYIFYRDRATCQVCGLPLSWSGYHAGHLQDRSMGGLDHPDNLVLMCYHCNMKLKPLHATVQDARHWLNQAQQTWKETNNIILRRLIINRLPWDPNVKIPEQRYYD